VGVQPLVAPDTVSGMASFNSHTVRGSSTLW